MKNIAENSFDTVHNLKDHPLLWIMNRISTSIEQEGVKRTNCGYVLDGLQADFKDELTGKGFIIEIRGKE